MSPLPHISPLVYSLFILRARAGLRVLARCLCSLLSCAVTQLSDLSSIRYSTPFSRPSSAPLILFQLASVHSLPVVEHYSVASIPPYAAFLIVIII